jgi:hypothetical protein
VPSSPGGFFDPPAAKLVLVGYLLELGRNLFKLRVKPAEVIAVGILPLVELVAWNPFDEAPGLKPGEIGLHGARMLPHPVGDPLLRNVRIATARKPMTDKLKQDVHLLRRQAKLG